MQPIVHRFRGDALLPADFYHAVMGAPTGCFGVVAIFVAVAKELGISISAATIEALYRFGAASFIIDQHLDETPECHLPNCECLSMSAREKAFRLLALAPGQASMDIPDWANPNLLRVWALLMSSLEDVSSAEKVVEDALAIAKYPQRQARTRSVFKYIWLLAHEDALTGRAAANCMSDAERAHPKFRLFQRYCGQIVNVWAVGDARKDLTDDFRTGQVRVKNNRFNRAILRFAFCLAIAWLIRRPRVLLAILEEKSRYESAQNISPRSWGPMSYLAQ